MRDDNEHASFRRKHRGSAPESWGRCLSAGLARLTVPKWTAVNSPGRDAPSNAQVLALLQAQAEIQLRAGIQFQGAFRYGCCGVTPVVPKPLRYPHLVAAHDTDARRGLRAQ